MDRGVLSRCSPKNLLLILLLSLLHEQDFFKKGTPMKIGILFLFLFCSLFVYSYNIQCFKFIHLIITKNTINLLSASIIKQYIK
jgi:hypothetical protein